MATLSVVPWESEGGRRGLPRTFTALPAVASHCWGQGCLNQALGYRSSSQSLSHEWKWKAPPHSCHAQLCRNVCSVCRAPVPPGQAVNILIRLLLNSSYGAEAESFGEAASCIWFLLLISEEVWSLSSGHGMFAWLSEYASGFSCSRWTFATSVFVLKKRYPRALAQRRQEQQEAAVWPEVVKNCQDMLKT